MSQEKLSHMYSVRLGSASSKVLHSCGRTHLVFLILSRGESSLFRHYTLIVLSSLIWSRTTGLSLLAIYLDLMLFAFFFFNFNSIDFENSTVICGEDAAIGSKETRQMFPDSRCRNQSWIPNSGGPYPAVVTDGQDGWKGGAGGVGANVIRKNGKKNRRLVRG